MTDINFGVVQQKGDILGETDTDNREVLGLADTGKSILPIWALAFLVPSVALLKLISKNRGLKTVVG